MLLLPRTTKPRSGLEPREQSREMKTGRNPFAWQLYKVKQLLRPPKKLITLTQGVLMNPELMLNKPS